MTRQKKILIIAAIVLGIAAFGYLAGPRILFGLAIGEAIRHNTAKLDRARPRFDALIRNKLKVGDSFDHAKKVLTDAGLQFTVERDESPPILRSVYLADGPGPGWVIELEIDKQDRISKVDILENNAATP
jgi:hypothetical protein